MPSSSSKFDPRVGLHLFCLELGRGPSLYPSHCFHAMYVSGPINLHRPSCQGVCVQGSGWDPLEAIESALRLFQGYCDCPACSVSLSRVIAELRPLDQLLGVGREEE